MASDETGGASPPSPSTPTAQNGELEKQRKLLETVFDVWRARLLDLTARNRALNYRPTKVSTLTIVDEKPAEVYRLLVGGEQALTFAPTLPSATPREETAPVPGESAGPDAPTEATTAAEPELFTPYKAQDVSDHHKDSVLQCHATPESLDLSLRRIAEQQRTSIEEQGVNSVFLALGFLHYRESASAKESSRAPLVLVPVTLERSSAKAGYRLLVAEDEPMVNPSLVEYLRRIHRFDSFPAIPEPSDDEASFDLVPFFSAVAERVKHLAGWRVTDEIVLAPFTFQKLVIYKDIEANQPTFAQHPLVRRVVLKEGEPAHELPPGIRDMVLDEQYPPEITNQVVDADSSQLRAIAAVAAGHDLVIHGPPGTGKSQTITNLIADALGAGKRVLFVSEKMAALEVVHRRLVAARLGEFCLELHSTKAKKAAVIESLRTALDSSGSATAGTVKSVSELARSRKSLNTYAHEVHTRRTTLQCTTFEAVGAFESTYDAPRFPFPSDPRALKPQELQDFEERLRHIETAGKAVEPVGHHGLRGSRITAFSESIADRIGRVAEGAVQTASRFVTQAQALAQRYGLREATAPSEVPSLVELADHIARSPGLPGWVLRDAQWAAVPPAVSTVIGQGRRLSSFQARLDERYSPELLDSVTEDELRYLDQKLGSAFAFVAFLAPRYRDIRRRLRAMRRNQAALRIIEQATDLKALPNFRRDLAELNSHPDAPKWFGAAWKGAASNWADLEARLAWLVRFHALVGRYGDALGDAGYTAAEHGGTGDSLPQEVSTTAHALGEALGQVRDLLAWPKEYLCKDSAATIRDRVSEVVRDLTRGAEWTSFVRAVNAVAHTPAAHIAEAAYVAEIPTNQVLRAFRRALYGTWLDLVIPSVPALADFTGDIHEDQRRRFQKLDNQLLEEKKGELVSKLREAAQRKYGSSAPGHRAFLAKELAKQKRHRPLRVILREAREAVAALKPCLLMSPLSVSQFLVPTADFDLVVFDEASQLPTEDAVAAICRGKKLVVVGDPKQLPPTNFFAVQGGGTAAPVDGDGQPVLDETESVLEEFQGVGLHQAHLEWHYRSAHQSLIQFSNEKFYGNRLVVFPSAATETPERGVKFDFVEGGQYEGAGLNSVEARRVATAVIEHFRRAPDLSLGVGTFSQRQQMAIWDELERARREDSSLEEFFDRARSEPFFVKNLENIQGDERDVIFLSVTYGKQADGKLRYNFGPLNRENGWRRLNVLVSRARKQMRVFSSVLPAEISPTAVASQGPALLADFLRFAETGKLMANATGGAADAESPFECEVGEALADLGFLVDRQVGVGKYRLDIGVRHRERPGVYLAGIECDGATYHAAPCARDRDRLRQYVLEQRGWTIVRVWSTDWFKNRARTLERLKRTLDDLFADISETNAPKKDECGDGDGGAPTDPVQELPLFSRVAEPASSEIGSALDYSRPQLPAYRLATATRQYRTALSEASVAHVSAEAAHIVAQEGPLPYEHVVDRLIDFWNHERRGSRLVLVAEQGIRNAIRNGAVSQRDGFLFANSRPVLPRNRSGLNVGPDDVSIEELAEAARLVLALADSMPEEQLAVEIREVLGLRRTHDGVARITRAIQTLVGSGVVVHAVAGLRLRDFAQN